MTHDRAPFWLVCRALPAFALLDLGFRFVGFERVLSLLLRRPAGRVHRDPEQGRHQAKRTFLAVQNATMLYYRRGEDCLPKALTTFHLLRRQGIPADLCFAVKKFPFAAHAWVEVYGEPLDDEPARLRRYTVLHRVAG